jgi:Zn-dependent peptidase ImmA (M78 family)
MRLCAEAGVEAVFVPELPRTGICGATRWLAPTKALIQLSLRYKTDDQFWFTFFHEAGHILLHRKKEVFLEQDGEAGAEEEEEAHTFARDLLIPLTDWRRFVSSGQYEASVDIAAFAEAVGVAPGIVVGRLQHDGLIPFSRCNELKRRLAWAKEQHGDEGGEQAD